MYIEKLTISASDIKEIISNALFFNERLENNSSDIDYNSLNHAEANKRLERWGQVAAQGNIEAFQKRILWSRWDIEKVYIALGTTPEIDLENLPSWANTLIEIVNTLIQFKPEQLQLSPLDPKTPLAFEDILLGIVFYAQKKLQAYLGESPLKVLQESAYLSLLRDLLQKLSNLTAKTLEFEFSLIRNVGQNLLNIIIGERKTTKGESKVKYDEFASQILSDGLLGFLGKYPVLGRLIATTVDFWVEAIAEFIQRLQADLPEIQQVFNGLNPVGKVEQIKTSLSDPHNQGRSVIKLTFFSGLKLIYKPKNLNLEMAFNQFVGWCNQQLLSDSTIDIDRQYLPLKVFQVINRDGYGWVECIEQIACEDSAAAKRYYLGAGRLLCLLYLLKTTDCHNENLIANGEHLVLIDMETLMQHTAKLMEDFSDETADLIAINKLEESVLATGLLPRWGFGGDDALPYDLSGLGSVEAQPVPIKMPVWKFVNTDDMYVGYEMIYRPLEANIPTLNGVALSPNDYIEELVTGFRQMYQMLMQQKQTLLSDNSPLAVFRSQQVRFIFRATRIYARIIQKSLSPEHLRNGLDWSIELDLLSRGFINNQQKPEAWPILQAELKGLSQLDIPFFTAVTDSDAINLDSGKKLASYFQADSYSEVSQRIANLEESNLTEQIGLIKMAFFARVAKASPTNPDLGNTQVTCETTLSSEQFLQEAEKIGKAIKERAIKGADGSVTWISLIYLPSSERYQLQQLGYNLYDGNCGVALFFAALANLTGNDEYRDLALKAIQPIQKLLNADLSAFKSFAQSLGIGGGTGLGSIIYSLVKISELLGNGDLYQQAKLVALLITPEIIAEDNYFDIVKGAAGAILGLLALYDKTKDAEVLTIAQNCAEHLLKYTQCYTDESKNIANHKPLTGFSHGAAGIAYSLLRLYAVTEEGSYLQAAKEAIAYENKFFVPNLGNWSEVTINATAKPVFWSTWCHGAPGIGLGRLGGLSIYNSEEILKNVQIALDTTYNNGLQEIDQLCCGNLGRADVMLVAAKQLSSPQWQETAKQLATLVVQRATEAGYYQLFGNSSDTFFSPCFFQGGAGIGYELLRLANPEAIPSVLMWE